MLFLFMKQYVLAPKSSWFDQKVGIRTTLLHRNSKIMLPARIELATFRLWDWREPKERQPNKATLSRSQTNGDIRSAKPAYSTIRNKSYRFRLPVARLKACMPLKTAFLEKDVTPPRDWVSQLTNIPLIVQDASINCDAFTRHTTLNFVPAQNRRWSDQNGALYWRRCLNV